MSGWIEQLFEADQVKKQGIVRRSKKDVERYASLDALKQGVKKRNFLLFENENEYVILCDKSGLTPIHV